MKHFLLYPLSFLLFFAANAQSPATMSKEEVTAVIEEQFPQLEQMAEQLDANKNELMERHIVLKYHQGNKDVTEATNECVYRVEEYNKAAFAKVTKFEATWYEQLPNIITIYTQLGRLKEAAGGGATDFDDFADRHQEYMDLMDMVQNDLDYIRADCSLLRQ